MKNYKIKSFDPTKGQLVLVFTNGSSIAVDVPIENGSYITGDLLDLYLKGFAPTWDLERLEKIKSGVLNEDAIQSMVETFEETSLTAEEKWLNIRLKRNELLALSDWTQLPDSPLNEKEKQKWAKYRSLLRDLTEKASNPDDIVFPKIPS